MNFHELLAWLKTRYDTLQSNLFMAVLILGLVIAYLFYQERVCRVSLGESIYVEAGCERASSTDSSKSHDAVTSEILGAGSVPVASKLILVDRTGVAK